ncbi:MAG: tetratricopeptide repeat protein [Thermodesulfobacteriota bacterium]|nr:tetratricopeptide repeat protein [Thermodesulfobacteriota bacterium]
MVVVTSVFSSQQILIAGTLSMENSSSDKDRQYRFAQALFKEGRFNRAAAEFERFASFFPEDPRVSDALYKAGEAYFKADQYQEAAIVCKTAIEKDPYAPSTAKIYLLLCWCQASLSDFDQALVTLHNLLSIHQKPAVQDEARYLGAWIFIETAQWPKARVWLQAITPQNRERYHVEALTTELSTTDMIPSKHPRLAGFFAVLPGAGHLYTGRYQDALVSFLLNTLTIWASYEAFDDDQPALGGLLGVVALNFYAGNIYSAVNSAHKFNRRATEAFTDRLSHRFPVRLTLGPVDKGGLLMMSIDF